MQRSLLLSIAAAALPAVAQVQVQITLPSVTFPAPPALVVVEPGVRVVPDLDDEVFFVDGVYWHKKDGQWFRTKDFRGGWAGVDAPLVPALLVKQQPGKFRRYRHGAAPVVAAPAPPPPAPPVRATPGVRGDDEDDDRGRRKKKGHSKKGGKGKGHDDDDDD
jgi:hypothetical protein